MKHREPLLKHHEPVVKHHETLLKHCETSWNTRHSMRYCLSMRRHRRLCGVSGNIVDCGVGITPQMCNRVTNHGDMGTFSKQVVADPQNPTNNSYHHLIFITRTSLQLLKLQASLLLLLPRLMSPPLGPVILQPYIVPASADRNRPRHNQYLAPGWKAVRHWKGFNIEVYNDLFGN